MWDETERFARSVVRAFAWLLAALGVALAAASLAAGRIEFFAAYLLILGLLAAIGLGYALAIGGVGLVLLGLIRGISYCLRRIGRSGLPKGPDAGKGPR